MSASGSNGSFKVLYNCSDDPEAGAMYVKLPPVAATLAGHRATTTRTLDLGHGLHLDFDKNQRLVGIELIYGASSGGGLKPR